MANLNIKFNNKNYSIDNSLLADATARLEAHLMSMVEERLEGDGAEYYTLTPTALPFRSTAPLNELQEVQINGVTVDPSNYTLEEGSTIVTFPIDYLKTLNVGSYEVAVASESKTVKGGFMVAAPELNEHGFYYNQPYTAYVEAFGGKTVFFIREDGMMDVTVLDSEYIETCSYTADGNNLIINAAAGTFTGTASETGIYCNELYTNFVLGDESIVADNDYLYVYKEDLGGYEVTAIDKTKAEYGAIKTGINGIDTVKLATVAFAVSASGHYRHENFIHCPTIPNSVTIIGDWAFYACSSLTSITIPDSVTNIGAYAFCDCDSLTSIIIPDSVTTIGSKAFEGCTSLTSIVIPDSVTCIRYDTFKTCRNLENVVIGNNVNRIEYDAFNLCDSLTSIVIPNSVTYIGMRAFMGCDNLTSIIFTGTTEQWHAITKETMGDPINNKWNLNVPATHIHCLDGDVAL